eukprot:TRINITY_DN90_c1_g1_i2.p1 TRINITY_DN90_c1_g1~~TRINITY_DN90_c1_g1_i2.p1  ORF type:complete len:102 (+),score=20.12 TRINITY_DN90_c1_g1_i2:3-308(+)
MHSVRKMYCLEKILIDLSLHPCFLQVAKMLVREVRKGNYHILCPDPLQNLLIMLKGGVTPKRNIFMEVLLAPLLPIVAWGYRYHMDSVARNPGTPPAKKTQ